MRHNDSTTTIALRFNGTRAGCGGDAGGSGGSDTAESKPEASVSADLGEDGGGDGGSWVDFAGTLTGKLQWGHSTVVPVFVLSTEMS
jgi:hypothetical protein